MNQRLVSALLLIALPALPLMAQLPAPNKAGVSAGHDVLRSKDPEAANKFWMTLGAQPVPFVQNLDLMKFPGLLILTVGGAQNGKGKAKGPVAPPAGSEGSSLDFIGFSVKDLKGSLAKWAAAGIKPEPGGTATQVYLMNPDNVKVRITEDKSLPTAIASDRIKMVVPDVAAAQVWYAKNFGAQMITRNGEQVADLPGHYILFEKASGPVAKTAGRAYDRIGLEVRGLEAFAKKLEDAGVKFQSPYRKAGNMDAAFAVLKDPWGTTIELSEGLASK